MEMKNKHELNSKYRVLLTELLPYELPLVLDNYAFFQICADEQKSSYYHRLLTIDSGEWTIPFDYEIYQKSGTKKRRLSLIHPLIQKDWVDIYDEYADYLLYLCNKSPFSVRYIHKVANCLIDAEEWNDADLAEVAELDELDTPPQELESSPKAHYRSFYQYRKYDFIFKFFESYEILRLEQKYPYLLTTDISNCFYHIYTHSVTWAIRGKETAKEHTKTKYASLIENRLDKLMQRSNYNETNGIVVGPEISRIFAEMILQRVDIDVMLALKGKGLVLGTDYEIRRYVDDYFIYAYRKEDLEEIKKTLEKCLGNYKLHINNAKTDLHERPFASNITDFKREVKIIIQWLSDEIKVKNSINDGELYLGFIHKYKSLVHHCEVGYSEIGSYVLSLLLRLIKLLSKSSDDEVAPILKDNVITNLIEIVFFIYSLDMNSTSSFKLCRSFYLLMEQAQQKGDHTYEMEVGARIEREIKRCFDYQISIRDSGQMNLDALNILITWHRVLPHSKIDKNRLAMIWGRSKASDVSEEDWKRMNYFQIATLLYIIENKAEFLDWKVKVIKHIKELFKNPKWPKCADTVCLYLDVLTCPYLSEDDKAGIMTASKNFEDTLTAKTELQNMVSIGITRWFWDWDKNRDFGKVLNKKAYHPAYG